MFSAELSLEKHKVQRKETQRNKKKTFANIVHILFVPVIRRQPCMGLKNSSGINRTKFYFKFSNGFFSRAATLRGTKTWQSLVVTSKVSFSKRSALARNRSPVHNSKVRFTDCTKNIFKCDKILENVWEKISLQIIYRGRRQCKKGKGNLTKIASSLVNSRKIFIGVLMWI